MDSCMQWHASTSTLHVQSKTTMIDEFDRDQDGEISHDEFLYIMKQSTM